MTMINCHQLPNNAREIRATPGRSRQLIILARQCPCMGLGRALNDLLLQPAMPIFWAWPGN